MTLPPTHPNDDDARQTTRKREVEAYHPTLYEGLHRGSDGDVAFYVAEAKGAGSVLELGCGYGRILAALADAYPNTALVGLDLHEGLLSRAEETLAGRATLVSADMVSFSLGRHFDRIFIPHSGLFCLLTEEEVRSCLTRVKAHLTPGGRVVLDAYSAEAFHQSEASGDFSEGVWEDEEASEVAQVDIEDQHFVVFEKSRYQLGHQRINAAYYYVPVEPGQTPSGAPEEEAVAKHTIAQRYVLSDELAGYLSDAGFVDVTIHGDFAGSEFDEASALMVVTASKAAGEA